MCKSILWILISLLLLPWRAASQGSLKDPLAIDILTRSAAALGSPQGAISTMSASGTYTNFGSNTPVTHAVRVKAMGPNRIRWETDRTDGTVITIIKGQGGRTEFKGKTTPLSISRTMGRTVEYLPAFALAHWLVSADVVARFKGLQRISGRDYNWLAINRVFLGEGNADFKKAFETITSVELYTDAETHFPFRLRYYEELGDWRLTNPADLEFSNFQRVGTATIPMTVTRYLGERKISEVQFQSVLLNIDISEKEF